jgi:hypothetical protein
MAESFGVTPAELRRTSRQLNDVSSRMKDVVSSLRERLAGEGAAWGDDRIGDQFANGEAGYVARLDWMCGSVDAKTGLLDYYSEALKYTADASEQNDQA